MNYRLTSLENYKTAIKNFQCEVKNRSFHKTYDNIIVLEIDEQEKPFESLDNFRRRLLTYHWSEVWTYVDEWSRQPSQMAGICKKEDKAFVYYWDLSRYGGDEYVIIQYDDVLQKDIEHLLDNENIMDTYKDYYAYFLNYTKNGFEVFSQATDILSQWYKCAFADENGVRYRFTEQYMMAQKAKLFDEQDSYNKIMSKKDPKIIKELGRNVKNFDQSIWDANKIDIVFTANRLKFTQNAELREYLISTENRYIVEANPNDTVWASGLMADDPSIFDPPSYKGENLLGKILMHIRDVLVENEYRNTNDYLFGTKNMVREL